MDTDKSKGNAEQPFEIKNNILIGKTAPRKSKCNHFGEFVLEKFAANPDNVGQVDLITGKQMTFSEMKERSIKCAIWLKKQGVKPGDVVAICTHNHLDSFVPCIAALYIGAIFNPWDDELNLQLARHFLKLSEPKFIFVNQSAVETVLEAGKLESHRLRVVVFGEHPDAVSFSTIMENSNKFEINDFQCTKVDTHSATVILFSSGTTGLPKGVVLSHYAWLEQFDVDSKLSLIDHVPLWFSSLYWISGVLLMLQAIVSSTTRLICPAFDEETACKIIEKYKVTWLFLSTSMGNRLAKSGYLANYDVSSVTFIAIGGAILKADSHELLKKHFPNALVLQFYGMTELCGIVTNQIATHKSGSCGIVASNIVLKVVDLETGEALGPNKSGELYVKSPKVFNGYYKNPQATKDILDDEGWLHTGDLVLYDEDGEFYIIDRLKELIKFRGYQVAPSEIENLLLTHPSVFETAVIGVPHLTDDEHPIAFVVKVPNMEVTEEELIDLVASNLTDHHKLRAGVKFLDTFPYTPSGKIARKELKIMAKNIAIK